MLGCGVLWKLRTPPNSSIPFSNFLSIEDTAIHVNANISVLEEKRLILIVVLIYECVLRRKTGSQRKENRISHLYRDIDPCSSPTSQFHDRSSSLIYAPYDDSSHRDTLHFYEPDSKEREIRRRGGWGLKC